MAGLVGAIIGGGQQSSADAQAEALQQQALQNLQNVNVPTIAEQQLNLALEKNAGQLSPEQEQAQAIQGNALSNITNNPALVNAQMQALQSLQQQGTQGLSASDKAALQQTENQLTQQANSQNQGTLQQFAQRGQAGSGASLAAQLMNNQNASNTANERALQTVGQAQQNALQATAAAGNLGTNIENQQYGQAANAAQAQNAINQFNTQNSQNVANTNTQAGNQAQAYNLNNAQTIGNTNTGIQNQQQQYNSGLYQQQFQDQFAKATGAANESNSLAGTAMQSGANSNKNTQAVAGQAGNVAGSAVQLFSHGGVVKGYDDGGSVTDSTTGDLLSNLANASSSNNGASNNSPASTDPTFSQKLSGLLSGTPVQSGTKTAGAQSSTGTNPIAALISKLQGGSNAGNAQQYGLTPQATQANNYGAQKLQLPALTATSQPPAPSGLTMPQLGQSQTGQQQAPNLGLAKGGLVRPPTPGNSMSMFRMLNKGGEASYKEGGRVPGKAKVNGDSPENDTVKAKLSPGELVIPRSIVGQPDNVIMDFIKAAKMHAKGGK